MFRQAHPFVDHLTINLDFRQARVIGIFKVFSVIQAQYLALYSKNPITANIIFFTNTRKFVSVSLLRLNLPYYYDVRCSELHTALGRGVFWEQTRKHMFPRFRFTETYVSGLTSVLGKHRL